MFSKCFNFFPAAYIFTQVLMRRVPEAWRRSWSKSSGEVGWYRNSKTVNPKLRQRSCRNQQL